MFVDYLVRHFHHGALHLEDLEMWVLGGIALLVIGIAVIDAIGSYFGSLWLERAGERIVHDLRVALYAHLQRLSLAFHDRQHAGDLSVRLTGDVNAIGDLFASSLGTMVSATLLLLGMIVVSLILD